MASEIQGRRMCISAQLGRLWLRFEELKQLTWSKIALERRLSIFMHVFSSIEAIMYVAALLVGCDYRFYSFPKKKNGAWIELEMVVRRHYRWRAIECLRACCYPILLAAKSPSATSSSASSPWIGSERVLTSLFANTELWLGIGPAAIDYTTSAWNC